MHWGTFLQGKADFGRWIIAPTSSSVNQLISAKRGADAEDDPNRRHPYKANKQSLSDYEILKNGRRKHQRLPNKAARRSAV